MAVGHAGGEAKLVKGVGGLLSFHGGGVAALDWVVALAFLVESDLGDNSIAEFGEDLLSAFINVIVGLNGLAFNLLFDFVALHVLGLGEVVNGVDVTAADVDEFDVLHLNHEASMD